MALIPVILSGGSGTRLWPLSRKSKPKQFLNFHGAHTLFQDTLLRCRGELYDTKPIIVGAEDQRFLIATDLRNIGVEGEIILEPLPRNSCAAIVAGCLHAQQRSPDAIVLALAADHIISDHGAFADGVAAAEQAAISGNLVTFGVYPTRPATGYGYIRPGVAVDGGECLRAEAFVEKPSAALAETYIKDGYRWNSGNFMFRADVFLAEVQAYAPEILKAVTHATERAQSDLDFIRLEKSAFETAPSISVDHAIMEKTKKAAVMPVAYSWTDLGSWDAVWDVLDKDSSGNAILGDGIVENGRSNLIHSEGHLTTLVDVDNLLVISTKDCLLVASKKGAENVKSLVQSLGNRGRVEATEALRMFRPWGNYERLDIGNNYQVKRLVIDPGGVLSLQKHRRRAEHWVVVSGEAEVTIGDRVETLVANQSIYVPLGTVHRLANKSKEPVILIEVQTGDYFGEDDIVRLEDTYNRRTTE